MCVCVCVCVSAQDIMGEDQSLGEAEDMIEEVARTSSNKIRFEEVNKYIYIYIYIYCIIILYIIIIISNCILYLSLILISTALLTLNKINITNES